VVGRRRARPGGATALLGIVFAAVQADVRRAIAYSSAENGGIIMVGYGVALAGAYVGNSSLVAVGLLAASLQVLTHAVAKTGLFLSAANFEKSTGTNALDGLSGMGRSQPWGAASFAASALALSGLPPTIGFVSEWFTFEALMQQFRLHPLACAWPRPVRSAHRPDGRNGGLHLCPPTGLHRPGPALAARFGGAGPRTGCGG